MLFCLATIVHLSPFERRSRQPKKFNCCHKSFLCWSRKSLKQPQRLTVFIASLSHQICISVILPLPPRRFFLCAGMSVTPCPSSNRFTVRGKEMTFSSQLMPASTLVALFCPLLEKSSTFTLMVFCPQSQKTVS